MTPKAENIKRLIDNLIKIKTYTKINYTKLKSKQKLGRNVCTIRDRPIPKKTVSIEKWAKYINLQLTFINMKKPN